MLSVVARDVADLCDIVEERIWVNAAFYGTPIGLTPRNCAREILLYERDRLWAKQPVDSLEIVSGAMWALCPVGSR